ncbi:unnamed protein product [Owenia fusiformis]|uniref:X-linked retinitis pigmentosa GTPase regulator n=1 Tax=Owenia fusiformis TaxID=6347 RepID=A0A8S4Q2H3_OWEFU|nr:unnamed protein product [Owenia fusiformis]
MATEDDSDIPETGAVFTYGKSKFADNTPNKFWIRNDRVKLVGCGDEHTALVAESGRVFTFGANDWGQLGLGNTKPQTKPSCIKNLKAESVKLIACGRSHTLLTTESGKLFGFGANGEGQLCLEDSPSSNIPVEIIGIDYDIKQLSAGTDHCCALTDSGEVYVWGGNSEGQLGLGEVDDDVLTTPTLLEFIEDVTCVSCGYYHTAVVTADGKLWTFGESDGGKLGQDGNNTTPQHVTAIKDKVISVACGGSHTVALTEKGHVYTFGDGPNGQLGHGTMLLNTPEPTMVSNLRTEKIIAIYCGESHTAVITDTGQLFTFGDGRHGKLGLGAENFANQFKPCRVSRFKHFDVESVSCGGCHMLALAHKKQSENGEISSSEEEEEEQTNLKNSWNSRGRDDIDLSSSMTAARNRRRRKEEPLKLNRTLPPLGGSRALPPLGGPPLGQTQPIPAKRSDPFQRGTLAPIKNDDKKPAKDEDEDDEDDDESEVSVTPEDSEEEDTEDEEPLNRTKDKAGGKSNIAAKTKQDKTKPKPGVEGRHILAKGPNHTRTFSPDDHEIRKLNKKLNSTSMNDKKEEEESEEEDSEEEDDLESKFKSKQKEIAKKKGKKTTFESEEDSEEEKDTKKSKNNKDKDKKKGILKNKKGKKIEDSEESEEEEEEESEDEETEKENIKNKKDNKKKETKKDTKKDTKKKKGGFSLFGKKKAEESEEDEDDDDEEEEEKDKKDSKKKKDDKKKDNKDNKKKKGKDDEEDEDDEDDEEDEEEKANKEKDKKKKGEKDKKDEKEDAPKKSKLCTIL